MKRVIDTAVADSGGTVLCRAAGNIGHRKTEDALAGGVFRRKKKIHRGLRHPAKGLDNGGADIETGCKIDDPVIADDLDIVGDPDTVLFQIADDTPGKTVSVTEDAVELKTAAVKMILQKAIDRSFGLIVVHEKHLIVRSGASADIFKPGPAPVRFALSLRPDAQKEKLSAAFKLIDSKR